MRLTPQQIQLLITALNPFLQHSESKLYLYGSRVQDNLKGGDIDLLIIASDNKLANKLLEKKHYLLANIKKFIGDQKIDLKISDSQEVQSDSFLQLIMPTAILLHQWKNPHYE